MYLLSRRKKLTITGRSSIFCHTGECVQCLLCPPGLRFSFASASLPSMTLPFALHHRQSATEEEDEDEGEEEALVLLICLMRQQIYFLIGCLNSRAKKTATALPPPTIGGCCHRLLCASWTVFAYINKASSIMQRILCTTPLQDIFAH